MPTPTIPAGNLFMNATLYTGTGAALTVTNGAPGQSFEPGFLWLKNRSLGTGGNHVVYDVVRGGPSNELYPNLTNAEAATTGALSSLNSNGFTLSNGGDLVRYNSNGNAYVAWQWKAGGAAVTNTAGTISSQVSANTTSGFSVVTYTGTAANATVGHGLGVAPSMIITKNRDSSTDWWVYHVSLGNTKYIKLNSTDAEITSSSAWNNTSPTSTVFSLGASNPSNANQDVAYCWTPIAGYSAFGSYTGNGSTDGPFIYTGFRPRFVLIKRTNAAEDWNIWDSSRSPFNLASVMLRPNSTDADDGTVAGIDLLSNGFKWRNTWSGTNASGSTYVYACWAENPFKYANAR